MSQPFIGEIKMFGGNFAIQGYALCNGQLLSISQNDALFSLIGTTYGGDGQNTFALPDLRGRLPIHQGSLLGTNFPIGQQSGSETVTLTTNQIPAHNHSMGASSDPAGTGNPTGQVPAANSTANIYSPTAAGSQTGAGSISPTGGNQPHDNMQPYLCVTFIIALFGIFPPRN